MPLYPSVFLPESFYTHSVFPLRRRLYTDSSEVHPMTILLPESVYINMAYWYNCSFGYQLWYLSSLSSGLLFTYCKIACYNYTSKSMGIQQL